MKYIKLPILWKNGDLALLEDLGIETSYANAETKDVYLRIDEIKWYFEDANPRYTCIALTNTEMVVDMPLEMFKNYLSQNL